MTLKELLKLAIHSLSHESVENGRLEAQWILESLLGLSSMDLITKENSSVPPERIKSILSAVTRRNLGEPLAYILEEKHFRSHIFSVGPGVLIPRPETELIVDIVINWGEQNKNQSPLSIADLGAGSGCIGLSLFTELKLSCRLDLYERSEEAIKYIHKNIQKIPFSEKNAEPGNASRRPRVLNQNLLAMDVLPDSYDVVVANPPYICKQTELRQVDSWVHKFEPESALFSADSGLLDPKHWLKLGLRALKVPGILVMEHGHMQAEALRDEAHRLLQRGDVLAEVRAERDLSGAARFLVVSTRPF